MREKGSWPTAPQHTRWPGGGRRGDPVFDRFFASLVPYLTSWEETEELALAALGRLLAGIGPAVLVTHSQGGPLGWRVADAHPDLVRAVVAVEPSGPPGPGPCPVGPDLPEPVPMLFEHGVTVGPLGYATTPSCRGHEPGDRTPCPPPPLPRLSRVPVLVVTADASYHEVFDHLTVDFLRRAGVTVDHLRLAERGLTGHGHLMMCELGNLAVADELVTWLADHDLAPPQKAHP